MCKPVKSIFFLKICHLYFVSLYKVFSSKKKKKNLFKVSSIVKNIFHLKLLTKPTNKCDFSRGRARVGTNEVTT